MGTLEISVSFFFFFFFFFFPDLITCKTNCPSYERCGMGEPVIEFPFRVKGHQGRVGCGYPGFDLTCNSWNKTVLELPFSGEFFVRYIRYYMMEIQIYDSDDCLPRRYLQNLNLSGSPFKGESYQNYTFLNCTSLVNYINRSSLFKRIGCLSSSTHTVLATTVPELMMNTNSCGLIATVSVPINQRSWSMDGDLSALNDDLTLTWLLVPLPPNLRDDPPEGTVRTKIIFVLLGFCIGSPVLILFICFIWSWLLKRSDGGGEGHSSLSHSSIAVLPQPTVMHELINVRAGLDDSTILSYPKVVLDESLRLPNPNNTTCSICLSEYRPKETLKSIPACNHCFHANCIDQWLRVNATCPVCRKSPIHSLPQPAPAT